MGILIPRAIYESPDANSSSAAQKRPTKVSKETYESFDAR
jgi:hypothetical protein